MTNELVLKVKTNNKCYVYIPFDKICSIEKRPHNSNRYDEIFHYIVVISTSDGKEYEIMYDTSEKIDMKIKYIYENYSNGKGGCIEI